MFKDPLKGSYTKSVASYTIYFQQFIINQILTSSNQIQHK